MQGKILSCSCPTYLLQYSGNSLSPLNTVLHPLHRPLLHKLLQEGEGDLGREEVQLLELWGLQDSLWSQREGETVQIVGRREKQGQEEGEEEAGVAIIWRKEEQKEKKTRPGGGGGGRKMLCKVCTLSFQGRPYSEYQEHIQTHRDETGMFPCSHPACDKVFKAWCHLNDHVYTHGKLAKPHSCSHCSYTSTTKANIRKHEMAVHEDPERRDFPCLKCPKKFKTSSNLMEHVKVHEPGFRHNCSVCNKQFRSLVGYQQHQRTHTGDLFSCKVCGEKFQSKHSASRHEKDVHGVYSPEEGGEGRVWRCALPSCRAQFGGEEEYRLHSKTAHQARSSVVLCELCRKICTNRAALRSHLRKEHSGQTPAGESRMARKEGRRSLLKGESGPRDTCSTCHKSFRRKQDLLSHMVTQHGSLVCPVRSCVEGGKVFSSQEVLEQHLSSHSQESQGPPCPHCHTGQPSRLVLNMHMKYCSKRGQEQCVEEEGQFTVYQVEGERKGNEEEEGGVVEAERREGEVVEDSMVITLQKEEFMVYQMSQ